MKRIIFLVLFFLLFGCSTTAGYKAVMDSWLGTDINRFISTNGYPHKNFTAPNGNEVYQWFHGVSYTTPTTIQHGQTTYTGYGRTTYSGNQAYSNATIYGQQQPSTIYGGQTVNLWCVTSLETDSIGRIIQWRGEGNSCRMKQPEKVSAKPTNDDSAKDDLGYVQKIKQGYLDKGYSLEQTEYLLMKYGYVYIESPERYEELEKKYEPIEIP